MQMKFVEVILGLVFTKPFRYRLFSQTRPPRKRVIGRAKVKCECKYDNLRRLILLFLTLSSGKNETKIESKKKKIKQNKRKALMKIRIMETFVKKIKVKGLPPPPYMLYF